jgi:hypothetical protein
MITTESWVKPLSLPTIDRSMRGMRAGRFHLNVMGIDCPRDVSQDIER